MATVFHPATGLPLGDPDACAFNSQALPTHAELLDSYKSMVISASGWRAIFAVDGEESLTAKVSPAFQALAGLAAQTFGEWLLERFPQPHPSVLVGIDSRATGPVLAEIAIRVFLGMGFEPHYLFIVAAPELAAYSAHCAHLEGTDCTQGFFYITASHNPPGHNGIKCGAAGAVIGGQDSNALIEAYKARVTTPDSLHTLSAILAKAQPEALSWAFETTWRWKRQSVSAYTLFMRQVAARSTDHIQQEALLDRLTEGAQKFPLSIVTDFNGSARCLSIDSDFLEGIGVLVRRINDRPGHFAHAIVPEGRSLDALLAELDSAHKYDPSFLLGYVPDCDGDRGNLAFIENTSAHKSRAFAAQETFACAVVAELASWLCSTKDQAAQQPTQALALVVNDATSLRIDRIAHIFGCKVFRVETGEAQVVGRAMLLRDQGYVVPIIGEGSNGGAIVYPSTIRDPLCAVISIVRLLLDRGDNGSAQPFKLWCEMNNQLGGWRDDFNLNDVFATLPQFASTPVFEERALVHVHDIKMAALVEAYGKLFVNKWQQNNPLANNNGSFASWEIYNCAGMAEEPRDNFADMHKGSLRILFRDSQGEGIGFFWLRKSGTEAVWRVMFDLSGKDTGIEARLLEWHKGLLLSAAADIAHR